MSKPGKCQHVTFRCSRRCSRAGHEQYDIPGPLFSNIEVLRVWLCRLHAEQWENDPE